MRRLAYGVILGFVCMANGHAQVPSQPLPLFRAKLLTNGDPAPLKLQLKADFSQIFGRRYGYGTDKKARLRFPAELQLLGDEAKQYPAIQYAEISGRGALRGNECPFSPLKIEFEGRPKAPSFFQGVSEIKVVTHCGQDILGRGVSFREQLLREFTVYRLHELAAAPFSFQTRLVEVRYIDSSGQFGDVLEYAIFVEDISDLARRLKVSRLYDEKDKHLKSYKPERQVGRIEQFQPFNWVAMQFFQTAIWNYDFDLGHNLKGIAGRNGWEPIPYDFDYAELFYQKPAPIPETTWLPFPYRCLSSSQVESLVRRFRELNPKFKSIIQNTELVSAEGKDRAMANLVLAFEYLESMPRPHNEVEISPCQE